MQVLDLRDCPSLCGLPDLSTLQYLRNVGQVLGDGQLFTRWEQRGRKATRTETITSRSRHRAGGARTLWHHSEKAVHQVWSTALYGRQLAAGRAAVPGPPALHPRATSDAEGVVGILSNGDSKKAQEPDPLAGAASAL